MSMSQGDVSVADNGAVTKSGAAGAVYDALAARFAARVIPSLGPDGKPKSQTGAELLASPAGVAIKRGMADQAVGIAALIPYITANGQTKIAAATGALQLLPTPVVAGAPTVGPGLDKFLPIV